MSQGSNITNNLAILLNKNYQIDGGGQFANFLVPSSLAVANCKEISNANAQCSVDFAVTGTIDFVRVNPSNCSPPPPPWRWFPSDRVRRLYPWQILVDVVV